MTKLIMTVDVNNETQKVSMSLNIEKDNTSDMKEILFSEFVKSELEKMIESAINANKNNEQTKTK